MKPIDFPKALGTAVALLAFNFLVVVLAVVVYSELINSGHPPEYYKDAATRIAPWCTRTVGVLGFFVASYFLSKRNPERSSWRFALAFSGIYILMDGAMVGLAQTLNLEFALAMLANLLAALAGAYVATRPKKNSETNLGALA